ncbi:MAG: hypothetical protein WD009_05130 [Phycisphaeraceae bacterium]
MRRIIVLSLAALAGFTTPATTPATNADTPVYTRDNAPDAPAVDELERRDSITQHGITWTFAEPAPVGRFVNGDWYVVGPVTVVEIDPRPRVGEQVSEAELDPRERESAARQSDGRYVRHGSTLNPPPRQETGYDSGIRNWFRPELAHTPPIEMQPGDTLVSTISLALDEETDFPYHGSGTQRGSGDASPVRTAAVLTCVDEPMAPDAFRPAYTDHRESGAERTIYYARNLNRDLLPTLSPPDGGNYALDRRGSDLDFWVRVFQRPWVNTGFFGFDQPMENMPHYGQWVGQAMSMAGLILCLDLEPAEKERLLIPFVQVGIDYWGAVRGGHPGWQAWGGHGSGRKFPIVLAGLLLGDDEMASPTRAYPEVNFGEDNQTMYDEAWTGAHVVFAGHSGVHHGTGTVPRGQWGPYEHLHPRDWDKPGQSNRQSEAYRRANSSSSWVGQALVLRLLGAEQAWAHDAFFDYVDRWMYEADEGNRQVIAEHLDWDGLPEQSWTFQGNAWEPFVAEMWAAYRETVDAPTDGWQQARDVEPVRQ